MDKPEKARAVFEEVSAKYQETLLYYSGFRTTQQFALAEQIISNMERYRSLVDIVIVFDTEEYGKAQAVKFNDYLKLFRSFYAEDEGIDAEAAPPAEDSVPGPIDSMLQEAMEAALEQD